MNTELELYHDILFLGLRPWTNRDDADLKFKAKNREVVKEYFSFQPIYEVDFIKPLSSKRKYYHSIIENEATRYLNAMHNVLALDITENEKKYLVHIAIAKHITQKLKEISKIIIDNHYYLELIYPTSNQTVVDVNTLDEIYIIQYLKFQLIRIFLEIQEAFTEYLTDEKLSEEELHLKFFSEPAPVKSYLKEAIKLDFKAQTPQILPKTGSTQFKSLAFDFRLSKKGIKTFKEIIKDEKRFSHFEEELFVSNLIDENYNFQNKHGQIQLLAAVFVTLIKKGYFNKRLFPKNIEIKYLDIRKFLDHRYNSDTDKQFRIWANDPNKLADFVNKIYWLDNLPVC